MPKKRTSKKRPLKRKGAGGTLSPEQRQSQSQKVIVNIHEKKPTKRRSRRGGTKPPTESMPQAPVVPNVIYQTVAPSIPQQFYQSPVQQFEQPKPRRIIDEIVEPVQKSRTSIPEFVDIVNDIGDTIYKDEFPPTANFISTNDLLKSQQTNEQLYKDEPFENRVEGNLRFGQNEFNDAYNEPFIGVEPKEVVKEEKPKKKIKIIKTPKKELPLKKRLGRPPGSKNKPKIIATPVLEIAQPIYNYDKN